MARGKNCKYKGTIYPHKAEFCVDEVYCFRCVDGELHPVSGIFPA